MPTTQLSDTPPLLTVKEAAQYLRLSMPTVWRMLHDGELPRTRIGGRTLIKRAALDALIADSTEEPKVA